VVKPVQHVHEARASSGMGRSCQRCPAFLPGDSRRGGHAPGGEGVFQVRDGWEGPAGKPDIQGALAASMRLVERRLSAVVVVWVPRDPELYRLPDKVATMA